MILEELKAHIKIFSDKNNLIEEYLNYVLKNSLSKPVKNKTENHHILPKSIFPEFSNLKNNAWNKSILYHECHLHAHYLLSKIFGGKMNYAFYLMINTNQVEYNLDIKKYKTQYKIAKEYSLKNNPSQNLKNIERMKINNPMFNEEIRLKVSKTLTGKIGIKRSDITKQKLSESKQGNKNHNYGKSGCFDHINNLKLECKYCGIKTTKGNISRWHNEKCKLFNQKSE